MPPKEGSEHIELNSLHLPVIYLGRNLDTIP